MATATKELKAPLKTSPYWPQGLPGYNYRQAAFLCVPQREVLFGGAAGPGKTVGLLLAALQYVEVPGYAALLLRRRYKQLTLPGQLQHVARKWLRDTDAQWHDKDSRFVFPSGAELVFGYLDSERDLEDALGPEYQFIGFDELTSFPEHHYTELFARLRRSQEPSDPLSRVPLRMRAASNPGGEGHEWVKQRFMVENHPARLFIPAHITDNPGLDAEDYIANSLSQLSPVRRRQLLDGDWDAKLPGEMFHREWFKVVDRAPARGLKVVRYWDLAASEPSETNPDPGWTVGLKLGYHRETESYYVLDVRRVRKRPAGVKKLVGDTAEADGEKVRIWIEQEPGASGKSLIDEYQRSLSGFAVRGLRSTGDKVTRADPVSARAEGGSFRIVRAEWNTPFLDELEDFPASGHDDQVDALSGAYTRLGKRAPIDIDPVSVTGQSAWR